MIDMMNRYFLLNPVVEFERDWLMTVKGTLWWLVQILVWTGTDY